MESVIDLISKNWLKFLLVLSLLTNSSFILVDIFFVKDEGEQFFLFNNLNKLINLRLSNLLNF